MAAPYDPRPVADRSPEDVPLVRVRGDQVEQLAAHLSEAVACAIDTETVYDPAMATQGPGPLRVVSAATRAADGVERAWVVDIHDVDRVALAHALQGVVADAWNAGWTTFTARRRIR